MMNRPGKIIEKKVLFFFNKINKFKKKYSHTILYAPHNFAESNHRCGDLIFRDFYQQNYRNIKIRKKKINTYYGCLRYILIVK